MHQQDGMRLTAPRFGGCLDGESLLVAAVMGKTELLERAGGAMRCAVGQADRRTKIHKGLVEGAGV